MDYGLASILAGVLIVGLVMKGMTITVNFGRK